jgi:hypothetical protein
MSVQIRGNGGTIGEVEANTRALIVREAPIDVLTGGAFRVALSTTDLTVIAARTATAGAICSFRNPHATTLVLLQRVRARWQTSAGFTAAQNVGLGCFVVRPWTVAYTGGTAVTTTAPFAKKRTSHGTSVVEARISTTATLTGSASNTIDTLPIAMGYTRELATGATIPVSSFEIEWNAANHGQKQPIILAQNEGIIVTNEILMGAGGTARVVVEIDWVERDSF